MSGRSAVLLLVLAAIWGGVYPLTTLALEGFPVTWVVFGRTAVAALVLLPFALGAGAWSAVRARPGRFLVAGLLQAAVPLTLLTFGQQFVSAGVAGVLSSTQPVLVAVLVLALDRAVRPGELLGVVVGLAGVALLFSGDLTDGATTVLGGTAVIASAALFAAGAVYIHRALPGVPGVSVAAIAMCLTSLVFAPLAAAGPAPTSPDATATASLVLLGVAGNGLALAIFYALIHATGPTLAALAWYLAPAIAVLLDIPLSGPPTLTVLAGLLLIVLGSAVTSRSSTPRQPTRPRNDTTRLPRAGSGEASSPPADGDHDGAAEAPR